MRWQECAEYRHACHSWQILELRRFSAMTLLLLLLGGLAVWGIVASILVVARDGYRRTPVRPPAETWRSTATVSEPADISAGQWLTASPIRPARAAHAGHAAGAMPLRPW